MQPAAAGGFTDPKRTGVAIDLALHELAQTIGPAQFCFICFNNALEGTIYAWV